MESLSYGDLRAMRKPPVLPRSFPTLCSRIWIENLREMGVGDLSVGKHMKKLASHYFGRIGAYEGGLEGDEDILRKALSRNLYATTDPAPHQVDAMAKYVLESVSALQLQPHSSFADGAFEFAPIAPGLDAP